MMNKELLILRHGKSSWEFDCDDFHRPLVERGKRGAEQIGLWLLQQNLLPDFILSSPAVRALETAQRCCKAMGFNDRHIYQDSRIYEANAATLKALLTECPAQAQRVMLVGHNPGLEHLLQDLVHEALPETAEGKLLPTATLAHVRLAEHWSQTHSGCGRLNSLTCASTLAQDFPFLTLNGTESRQRPAYYYAQSGVIPYRTENHELQILMISVGSKGKWAFPKGVIEPGLSSKTSAAKEAFEEAGLKGIVTDAALGRYTKEKWGGICTIEVFPMQVTEIVDTEEWLESHRLREWFSAKQALEQVKNSDLLKMLKNLLETLQKNA
jgi:phosphohistidine phosphatase